MPNIYASNLITGHGPQIESQYNCFLDIDIIKKSVREQHGYMLGEVDGFNLHTAIQPIYSLSHKRIVGYEALARIKDAEKNWVNPADFFNSRNSQKDVVFIDRLCRYIHTHNFSHLKDDLNWLFLNVSPQTIMSGKFYGPFIKELLEKSGFPPHRLVLEIIEHPIPRNEYLLEIVNYCKSLGCLIAIDDFGAGSSNFDRIWTLSPDIVKLDRSILLKATRDKKIRQFLPGMVSLLHQAGALVLVEGIETKEQAMIAMGSEADFVQGFYFAEPGMDLKRVKDNTPPFDKLFENFKANSILEENQRQRKFHAYHSSFQNCIEMIKQNVPLEAACRELLVDEAAIRCYLLTPDGIQVHHTVVSESRPRRNDIRFRPLENAKNADWFRRYYLKRATDQPGQLQISRPYLSIAGVHMCVTLSMMFPTDKGDRIFCCDLHVKNN